MANTISMIAGAVKEGLSLWKTFIATRQQAYERKMDKRQEKALNIAEESFDSVNLIFDFLSKHLKLNDARWKEYYKLKKDFYSKKKKFNKYD